MRRPQDGRISLTAGKRMVDLRISTMPSKFGEKIVLRILDAEANVADLKSLLVFEPVRQLFSEMVFRPHGLVLVTGPTGSGKTTTMYSALFARKRPELNVVTVEDPIEYHLDGITQIQVQPDITSFASVLRALLRQDPNVIMVGETRDRETAKMAVEASTTGHTVLTSMHTNSALETMYRLLDLGVERYAIANSLLGVLHQRLARRLCPACSEPYEYPAPIIERLFRAGAFQPHEKPTLRRAVGCARCGGTGYKGRVAVTELLVASDAVRTAFSAGADLSAATTWWRATARCSRCRGARARFWASASPRRAKCCTCCRASARSAPSTLVPSRVPEDVRGALRTTRNRPRCVRIDLLSAAEATVLCASQVRWLGRARSHWIGPPRSASLRTRREDVEPTR